MGSFPFVSLRGLKQLIALSSRYGGTPAAHAGMHDPYWAYCINVAAAKLEEWETAVVDVRQTRQPADRQMPQAPPMGRGLAFVRVGDEFGLRGRLPWSDE